jgi:hypothetical protein
VSPICLLNSRFLLHGVVAEGFQLPSEKLVLSDNDTLEMFSLLQQLFTPIEIYCLHSSIVICYLTLDKRCLTVETR